MTIKSTKPKVIVVLGPTASGKSDLAIQLAKKYGGEVVSADSRQVYRGMDLGTGKVPRNQLRIKDKACPNEWTCPVGRGLRIIPFLSSGVPHHLLDVASPRITFSVARYQKLARVAIADILKRGKVPIVCGGTGFYIDATLYDYNLPPVLPNPRLRAKLDKQPTEKLFQQLKKLDPRRAGNIDSHNRHRLIRALEIVLATGRPVATAAETLRRTSPYDVLKLGVNRKKEILDERIHIRLIQRLRQGMVTEIRKLHGSGVSWRRLEDLGLEYRYVGRYLRGVITREELITQLESEIRRYAKRQMTWFKRDSEIIWIKNLSEANRLTKKWLIASY